MTVTLKEIWAALLMLIFSVTAAVAFNQLSPKGIAFFGQWERDKGVVTAIPKDLPLDASIEISHLEKIRQIVEKKERLVMDVRPADFYHMGHLPGAVSYPLDAFNENVERLLRTVKKDAPVLVYCSGFDCDASHMFAQRLMALHYTDVRVFPGGFGQWQEMGFEIEKDEE